jgi:hypothetical protein
MAAMVNGIQLTGKYGADDAYCTMLVQIANGHYAAMQHGNKSYLITLRK